MIENRRFYYLKLKENFYNSETMVILESMQDGLLYSNLLLKMYLMSLRSNGVLMLNDYLPHTVQTIATFTRHQVGTVERALKIFQEFGLVEILTDGAYYTSDVQLLIGQSSSEGERKKRERMRLKRRKAQGLQDRYLYAYTFTNDNGQNPVMEKAHAYVEHWKEAYRDNTGHLLFGDVGTGKSFFAGCIANALLDRDVPVLMTNFPSILNRLTGVFAEDRAAFIASLDDYGLLVIDDLGVERSTEYAMEQMFTVIDSRYRSNKPLIVTTNLKLEEIKNPPDLAHSRIYDRILERCAPVLFSGKNFRKEGARATKAAAKEIVSKG